MQIPTGISTLRNAGWRLTGLVWVAATTKQPSTRHRVEVALLDRCSKYNVMAMNPTFNRIIRFVFPCFRFDQRVTVSQKKNIPLPKHKTPSIFLLNVAPTYSGAPVQAE